MKIFEHEGEQLLNSWLVGILWIKIIFSSLGIIGTIVNIFTDSNYSSNPIVMLNVVLAVCAVIGGYWLTQAEKRGFYLIVVANVVMAILSYYQYTQISASDYGMFYNMAKSSALRGVWGNVGQIIFLMLLMLLKKDGKNAYEVIWNKRE